MTLLTQPLRDEHKELLPHIANIRVVANLVDDAPPATLKQEVDGVLEFLTHHLIPHAQAEDEVLYPAVAKAVGAEEVLATMRFDHVEVGRLTEQLATLRSTMSGAALSASQVQDLHEVLFSLYGLVKAHFTKEEEIFLPILDAKLTPTEAQRMFETMEAAAGHAKAHLVG